MHPGDVEVLNQARRLHALHQGLRVAPFLPQIVHCRLILAALNSPVWNIELLSKLAVSSALSAWNLSEFGTIAAPFAAPTIQRQ